MVLVNDGFVDPCNFFIIRLPDFSAAFLPILSPACEIPDSIAFFVIGLATLLKADDARLFNGLKMLSMIRPLPLCS